MLSFDDARRLVSSDLHRTMSNPVEDDGAYFVLLSDSGGANDGPVSAFMVDKDTGRVTPVAPQLSVEAYSRYLTATGYTD